MVSGTGRDHDAPTRDFSVRDTGLVSYRDALYLQRALREERIRGKAPDTVLLVEHPPVITLGRSHPEPDLAVPAALVAAAGIEIVQVERGGDITYHGPGQLVVYGIIDLRAWDLGVTDYVSGLESCVIGMAAEHGVTAGRKAGARGAWVDDRKLASVGVHVSRGVTLHGIAINIDMDLSHFEFINPCGMPGTRMTTLAAESGRAVTLDGAKLAFLEQFTRIFRTNRLD